jgi:hypothetical protein
MIAPLTFARFPATWRLAQHSVNVQMMLKNREEGAHFVIFFTSALAVPEFRTIFRRQVIEPAIADRRGMPTVID